MTAPDDAPSGSSGPTPGAVPDPAALAALARAGAESLLRTLGRLAARVDAATTPPPETPPDAAAEASAAPDTSRRTLRATADRLLALSRDTKHQPGDEHPAFARILSELAPDEARILQFLLVAGPQPSIDVTGQPLTGQPPIGHREERVGGGIDLIATMAGCARPERGPQYLANLERLGVVQVAAQALPDPRRYALLEAQPATASARARVRRARTVHRTVRLTVFGQHFCQVCFTDDGTDRPDDGAPA